jgi:hypothetical protein
MTIYEYLFILSIVIVTMHIMLFKEIRDSMNAVHKEYRVTRHVLALAYIVFYLLKLVIG